MKKEIPFVNIDAVDEDIRSCNDDDVVFLRVGAVNETIDDTGMISACPPLSPLFESPSSPDVPREKDIDDTGMISACPPLSALFESPSSPDVPVEEEEDDDDESDEVVPPSLSFQELCKRGAHLSAHEKKKRAQAVSLLEEWRSRGDELTPHSVIEIGTWAMVARGKPLKKTSWDTLKPHVIRLVAEELEMPQSAVRQAIADAMEDLNRISRNFLPDGRLKSQAAPLMKFDLENLKSVFSLDSLSRPQLELFAILELGLKSGARFASIERTTGESIEEDGIIIDTGFKTNEIRNVFIHFSEEMTCLKKLLESEYKPHERIFNWSVSRVDTALDEAGIRAGYPRRYFTSHSMRRGFVNQKLLDSMIAKSSLTDVITGVCFVSGWALTEASQVDTYVDERLRSILANGNMSEFQEKSCLTLASMFHGFKVEVPVVWKQRMHLGLVEKVEDHLELKKAGKAVNRGRRALRGVLRSFPEWKRNAEEVVTLESSEDCSLEVLTRIALIHGLFSFDEGAMAYQGSVEQILALYRRMKKREDILPVNPSTLLIPTGDYQGVQADIIARRRNKRNLAVMME